MTVNYAKIITVNITRNQMIKDREFHTDSSFHCIQIGIDTISIKNSESYGENGGLNSILLSATMIAEFKHSDNQITQCNLDYWIHLFNSSVYTQKSEYKLFH